MRIGDSDRWIDFTKDPLGPSAYRVRVAAEGIAAEAIADFDQPIRGRGDIAGYLTDLAKNWKGWEGPKRFETTESELSISATHDGRGRVEFQIDMRRHPWSVRNVISVDAGDLERLAADTRSLFKREA